MQCNIDQRGRQARLSTGSLLSVTGIVLLIVGIARDQHEVLIAGVVCLPVGLFVIFEGLKGWCALRAMGIKTRL